MTTIVEDVLLPQPRRRRRYAVGNQSAPIVVERHVQRVPQVVAPQRLVVQTTQAASSARALRNRRRRARRRSGLATAMSQLQLGVLGATTNRTRLGVSGNPADPRTTKAYDQLGSSTLGRKSALRVLHPCGEYRGDVPKLPDGAVSTSVVLERRDEFDVRRPPGTTQGLWSALFVSLPFLKRTTVVLRWFDAANVSEAQLAAALELFLVLSELDPDYPRYPKEKQMVAGTGIWVTVLDAATISNDLWGNETTAEDLFIGRVKSIRRVAMGTTTDLNAPALSNQGRVVSGQWNPDVALSTFSSVAQGPPVQVAVIPIYEFETPALTESTIVQSDEFCRQAEAKTGSYVPFRFSQPEVMFTSATEARRLEEKTPGVSEEIPGNSWDLWLRGWSVCVEEWSSISDTASLRVKRREILELIPAPHSVYSPFATPAYPEDVRAMSMIREFARSEPHAFPAEFNDMNELWPVIIRGVGAAVAALGLPLIGPAAGLAIPLAEIGVSMLPRRRATTESRSVPIIEEVPEDLVVV